MRSLGQIIREARVSKGISQTDLADGIVTPSMISQIEADRAHPSEKVLRMLANRLDIPFTSLIDQERAANELNAGLTVSKALIKMAEYDQAIETLTELVTPATYLPTLHAAILCELAECYTHKKEYHRAIDVLDTALHLFEERSDTLGVSRVYTLLGGIQYYQSNHVFARHYWKRALDVLEDLEERDPFLEAKLKSNLGAVHYVMAEFDEAIMYYQEANDLIGGAGQLPVIASIYQGLGLAYKRSEKYELAIKYSQKAISIYDQLQNVKLAIDCRKNYAILITDQGQLDDAFNILIECRDQYDHHNYPDEVCNVLGEMARIQLRKGNIPDARSLCEQALNSPDCPELERAYLYRTLAEADLQEEKLQESITHMEQAVEIFETFRVVVELPKSYSFISRIYERLGDFKSANKSLHKMQQHVQGNLRERGVSL